MNASLNFTVALVLGIVASVHAGEVLFQDDFKGKLGDGWSWLREDKKGWRVSEHGLEIATLPGNMWGPSNNAKNVLVRSVPDPTQGELEISVTITNQPTEQYEQVDMVWYYDDSNMVKIGQELVDGKLSVVMGREQADKTRTISIIPLKSFSVRLQFLVTGNRIRGEFRTPDSAIWQKAGECDLPVHGPPKLSFQCYQGPATNMHWARINGLRIQQRSK